MKPRVNAQGLTIIEKQANGEILVCTPDGQIELALTPEAAQEKQKAWAKRHAQDDAMNVVRVEWRGFKISEVPT